MATHQPTPTILLPKLPPKTLVGIDLITFTSTPNFHGIRDLSPGWHFLYTGATETLSLRSGAWFYIGDISTAGKGSNDTALVAQGRNKTQSRNVQGTEIYIWKWCADTESLVALDSESDSARQEGMRYKANLGSVWQSGGLFKYRSRIAPSLLVKPVTESKTGEKNMEEQDQPEPQIEARIQTEDDAQTEESGRRDWSRLTDRISPNLLSRVIGNPEVDIDGHPRWVLSSASTANRDADHIPGVDSPADGSVEPELKEEAEREFEFIPIDLKRTWREGAVGRERTEAAQDRSWALGDLIDRAIVDREDFMTEVLRILSVQLQRCDDVDGGLFEIDGDEGGAFLRDLLIKFRQSVDDIAGEIESKVKSELDKLEEWVKAEYDWELRRGAVVHRGMLQLEDGEQVEMDWHGDDEEDETGEYAPMIVE
ncbi:A1 cistron-splicing factor AAR2 [Penicillium coprophilum]|uniref:A1 cistron-splicing factor AAR2 n=1 Tax=Penicillium coprophilum TaxID=36646 RepID=UPI002389B752|nr:A1 cistron-splicing factor AAR2 [Penicillium coprophilum]KAJ5171391.1 A1 cistron-splicing factor AAR2 [Penicillium coprophilum]